MRTCQIDECGSSEVTVAEVDDRQRRIIGTQDAAVRRGADAIAYLSSTRSTGIELSLARPSGVAVLRMKNWCDASQVTTSVQLAGLVVLLVVANNLSAQNATERHPEVPRVTTLGVDYSHVSFQQDFDPWNFASVSLGRRTGRGSLIGRVNYANRFGSSGSQVEVDAYPRLTRSTYAYLSVGYSASGIFPAWRSGGELFTSLPRAWEASLGYRQLRFGGAPVTLFTGAVGKYVGDYWFSLRPYMHATGSGTSASANLTSRRYFADGDHYVGGRISYGDTPPDQITPDQAALARVHAFSASAQGSGGLFASVLGTWSLGYDREELALTRIRRSWTAATGLRVPF